MALTDGLPSALRSPLALDAAELARAFLALSKASTCRISLKVVTRDACRRFHYDYVRLRMLCTYVGPGTLWVAREHVNMAALEEPAEDVAEQNTRIVPEAARILEASPMDVLLLKGARFQGGDGIGAVHRSPAAGTLHTPRLVLTIDDGLRPGESA